MDLHMAVRMSYWLYSFALIKLRQMIEKLEEIKKRFEEVGQLIVQPDAMADMSKYTQLNKEYKDLEKIVIKYNEYKLVSDNLANAKEVLSTEKDPEFREMAKGEIEELTPRKEEMEEELKWMLIPKDPNDSRNVILEIRAGTGGDEASLFVGDLFRMYKIFAESQKYENATKSQYFASLSIKLTKSPTLNILSL